MQITKRVAYNLVYTSGKENLLRRPFTGPYYAKGTSQLYHSTFGIEQYSVSLVWGLIDRVTCRSAATQIMHVELRYTPARFSPNARKS